MTTERAKKYLELVLELETYEDPPKDLVEESMMLWSDLDNEELIWVDFELGVMK